MKTFKEMISPKTKTEGNLIEEGMGKRALGFNGIDEVGDFYIVTHGSSDSELNDIFWKADAFDLALQFKGGLNGYDIVGIYKDKKKAKKIAKALLKRATSNGEEAVPVR